MGLLDVLAQFGFDKQSKARLARHQDTRKEVDFKSLIRNGHFEEYQRWQARPVFHNADFVVAFTGDGAGRARFWGVYRVTKFDVVAYRDLPDMRGLWPWQPGKSHFHYTMIWQPEYEALADKLVIKWSNERAWVQHLKNYEVLVCPTLRDVDLPTWSPSFVEGKSFTRLATSRERSREARDKCLELNGCKCSVCEMTFPEVYGGLGDGFMHVHHNTAISSRSDEYQVDPQSDLKPVCPNCHAMLHWNTDNPRTIESLRTMLRRASKTKLISKPTRR